MPTCTFTPDLPLLSPDLVVPDAVTLAPDGYVCGPPAGGGTPALSGAARGTRLHSGPTAGLASRPRAGTLTSRRGG